MRRRRFLLLSTGLLSIFASAPAGALSPGGDTLNPPPLPREFRAAWITPVQGFDWPSRPDLSAEAQKAELIDLLDRARAAHLNAVIFHVRIAGDALYKTRLAPWSAYLSGESGKAPGYDPLAFAIAEAHARGLVLHAWFNPFRATPSPRGTKAAPSHVTRRHPGWIVQYGRETWINPGIPAARNAVLASIFEVVEKYDIDGVHLDDFFYPYREDGAGDFDDPLAWRKYGKPAGFQSRAAWRRNNIDRFIEALYAGVHERKPWLPVGVSPFGIWKSGVPAGVTGLDSYSEIYADARLWLRQGWVDYLSPQLYWPMDGKQQRFGRLLEWWQAQNAKNRHIWPGLAAFLAQGPAWQPGEIGREIEAVRASTPTAAGHVHFHLTSALGRGPFYDEVAIVPAMPHLAKQSPAAPLVRARKPAGDSLVLTFAPMKPQVRWLLVQSRTGSEWKSELRFRGTATTVRVPRAESIVVTPLSRTGALGEPLRVSAGKLRSEDRSSGR